MPETWEGPQAPDTSGVPVAVLTAGVVGDASESVRLEAARVVGGRGQGDGSDVRAAHLVGPHRSPVAALFLPLDQRGFWD